MNCLIDTQTFLWSVFDPDQLSIKARTILQESDNTIHLSVVSFWEISLKYAIGKLELFNILPDRFPEVARQMEFEILNLAPKEAATFYKLPKIGHKDPFDRLIIWQAIHQKMTLISKDRRFKDYKGIGLRVVW
jgi:PIN domain nuclease of toxin-antitoxin system